MDDWKFLLVPIVALGQSDLRARSTPTMCRLLSRLGTHLCAPCDGVLKPTSPNTTNTLTRTSHSQRRQGQTPLESKVVSSCYCRGPVLPRARVKNVTTSFRNIGIEISRSKPG
jgi:hypothetical protein